MPAPQRFTDDELIAALKAHPTQRAAARALGVVQSAITQRLQRLAAKGYSPAHDMTHPVPDGFRVKGVSTLYGQDGLPRVQWVKSQIDPERQRELLVEALAAMGESIPREKPRPAPTRTVAGLLNCYIVTDFHLGMLSWHEETGADWDTAIAEDLLVGWFARAIAQSPDAHTGVLAQLGDFLHWDGLDAVTPASKHLLDADTRFQKLVRVAIRALRRVVSLLLAKHERVHLVMAEGNHDPASSIWLREWFAVLFENEPRVSVDLSPDPYYCVEWGQTALFFHHGHKRKPADIDTVFASKFREVFGRTKHAFAHMGHMHHIDQRETNLMVVEQHRTLAAPDAYAARGGWASGRDAQVITYGKAHGEVGRVRVSAAQVLEAAA
jgi:hypothetical protein